MFCFEVNVFGLASVLLRISVGAERTRSKRLRYSCVPHLQAAD
jgi:hypothetical protein